jgi:hypothetical protein
MAAWGFYDRLGVAGFPSRVAPRQGGGPTPAHRGGRRAISERRKGARERCSPVTGKSIGGDARLQSPAAGHEGGGRSVGRGWDGSSAHRRRVAEWRFRDGAQTTRCCAAMADALCTVEAKGKRARVGESGLSGKKERVRILCF